MIRSRRRMVLCCVLVALNLAFIWGNSLLDGGESGSLSQWVQEVLGSLFPIEQTEEGGHLLRKCAHFCEFACLGCLLTWLMGMLGRTGFVWGAIPVVLGCAVAFLDETIQRFSPGRTSSLADVCLDTVGCAFGMAILLLMVALRKRRKKEKNLS